MIKKSQLYLWDLDMWPQTLEATGIIKSKIILKILESIFKSFYSGFDYIFLGSKYFKEIASKRIKPSRIKYFPNWADSIFEEVKIKNLKIIKNQKLIISYTGNIGESQNFESLVEAVSAIENRNFEIRLIGDGRNKKKLIDLVEKKQLKKTIKFFDSVKPIELVKYFEESHFLYISLKNSLLFEKTVPAKLQTYLAVGIPIIGYINGEASDLIKKHNLGYTCDSSKFSQLTKLLKSLSTLKDNDYQKVKINCRLLYNKQFHSNKKKKRFKDTI